MTRNSSTSGSAAFRDVVLSALANIPDDMIVQVGIPAGALRRALEKGSPAPAIVSTVQAARYYGESSRYWRERCEEGRIVGAYKEGRSWRMPKEGVEGHLEKKIGRAKGTSRSSFRPRGPHKRKS